MDSSITIKSSPSNIVTTSNGSYTTSFGEMKKVLLPVLMLISSVVYGQDSTRMDEPKCLPIPEFTNGDSIMMEINRSYAASFAPPMTSNPGSENVLYLNFNGALVVSNQWHTGDTFYCEPANMVLDEIVGTFNLVVEDLCNNNVAVTTDSLKYLSAPPHKRQEVIITSTAFRFGTGWAHIGSFNQGVFVNGIYVDDPCFVFSGPLQGLKKYVGEVCTHEAGHTLWLWHQSRWQDSIKLEEYHSGSGPQLQTPGGGKGHGKIMGVGYYKEHTTWDTGRNNLGSFQDDRAIIAQLLPPINSVNVLQPGETETKTVTVTVPSVVTITGRSGLNTDLKLTIDGTTFFSTDSLHVTGSKTLNPGVYSYSFSGNTNNWATTYTNGGQYFPTVKIEPLTVTPVRPDSQYIRRRTERWNYSVWTMYGQKVKQNYGELGKATDNLPPATYFIKFGPYTTSIFKH